MSSFESNGYRWSSLLQYRDLDCLAEALDSPEVTKWLCRSSATVEEALSKRLVNERVGKSITFVVEQHIGIPLGFAGLIDYPAKPNTLQTTTYLSPRSWGSGLAGECKKVQASLASALELKTFYSSTHVNNTRSWKSLLSLFPDLRLEEVDEPWIPRRAKVMELPPAPDIPSLPEAEALELYAIVRSLPLARRILNNEKEP